jgi:predicted PurR-regulated permease PerM
MLASGQGGSETAGSPDKIQTNERSGSTPERRFSTRVLAIAGAALLLYLLARILQPFFGPILWALLLAFLLFPANRWLRRKMRGRNGAAALLLTLAVTLGIVIPAASLMLVFVRQAGDLLTRVSGLATRYQIERPQDLLKIPALGRIVQWIDEKTPIAAAELQQWLINAAKSALELAVSGGRQILLGAVGAVIGLLLMLFILYFLLSRRRLHGVAHAAPHSHGGRAQAGGSSSTCSPS